MADEKEKLVPAEILFCTAFGPDLLADMFNRLMDEINGLRVKLSLAELDKTAIIGDLKTKQTTKTEKLSDNVQTI